MCIKCITHLNFMTVLFCDILYIMIKKELKISSHTHFEGNIIKVIEDDVQLPDGQKVKREVVRHDPAVVVIAFEEPDIVYLINQFRYPVDQVLLEACAGIINQEEDPLLAAKRELKEETGIIAQKWDKLAEGYPAPGFCDEYMHYYLARQLSFGETQFDSDEYVELNKKSFEEIESLIDSFQLIDSKTLNAYLLLRRFLEKEGR